MARRRSILLFSLVCILAIALYRHQTPISDDDDEDPLNLLPAYDTDDRDEFIKYVTNANETIRYKAIQTVCAKKTWREDVVFNCDMIAGGIGNVRNHLLNCIRYTIEGGGSLIMPQIMRRNLQDLSEIETDDWQDLGYMFDKTWLQVEIGKACPQLKLWETLESVPAYKDGILRKKRSVIPRTLDNWVPKYGLAHPEFWRGWFDEWLLKAEEEEGGEQEAGKTVHFVGLGRAYLEFPTRYDGPAFVAEFGKILRFNHDSRYLAANILWNMRTRFFSSRPGIMKAGDLAHENSYFGIHLRTEADAMRAWPVEDWKYQRYEIQSSYSIRELHASQLQIVYVASGNVSEVARLSADIRNHPNTTSPMTVVTKHDLLANQVQERELLGSMTFDQAALVDFIVMQRASKFVGIGHSSFAWNIAFKRHALVKHEKTYLDPGPQLLRDNLSVILGDTRTNIEYPYCMWP